MSTSTFDGTEWRLKEFDSIEFDEEEIDGDTSFEDIASFLLENFSSQVEVQLPTLVTGGRCVMKNQGYVGYIQTPTDHSIRLVPKVDLDNIFEMMEWAYDLGDFDLEGIYESDTVEGFYDRIANIFSQTVIDRRKRGLYRSYVDRSERSQRIRGRIDFAKTIAQQTAPDAHIHYSEITADNEDNQILLYTPFVFG